MAKGEFGAFIETRRSLETRRAYMRQAPRVVGDPDSFIDLARSDRLAAEKVVESFILDTRKRAGGSYINYCLSPLKSFLKDQEVLFSWRKLNQMVPQATSVAEDRAPEIEEVRKMWAVANPRERMIVAMLTSFGGRVGAFWFPSLKDAWKPWGGYGHMMLRDVVFDGDGPATLTVYPGEPERYQTLVSPEAVSQLRLTLELRERVKEKLTPESPVLRDAWSVEYAGMENRLYHPEEAHPVCAGAISKILQRLKRKAGITTTSRTGGFKAAHGFRKFFRSNFPACPLHGDLEAEVLMGHKKAYEKLSWSHVKERYLVAVPHLSIDERFSLKEQIAVKDREHSEAWRDTRLQVLELKDENRALKETLDRLVPVVEKMKELQKEYQDSIH
jgi:hypothetical protein